MKTPWPTIPILALLAAGCRSAGKEGPVSAPPSALPPGEPVAISFSAGGVT